jgi:hypothetical protein
MVQVVIPGIPSAETFGAVNVGPLIPSTSSFALTSAYAMRRDASIGSTFVGTFRDAYVVTFASIVPQPQTAQPPMPEPDTTTHAIQRGTPHQRVFRRYANPFFVPPPVEYIGRSIDVVRL